MGRFHVFKSTKGSQGGFTLLEILVVVAVIGVLSIIMAPLIQGYTTSMRRAYDEKQNMLNISVGQALLNYAANSTSQGRLPAPYTGGGYTSTIYDPANATLSAALTSAGLAPTEVNDDGSIGAKVRVYQRVAGLTASVPLYFQSGPLTTLSYEYAGIYITECVKLDGTCNPTPATGVPGSSSAMTSANYTTWQTAGTDSRAVLISTLPLQKSMLASTVQRLDKVRDTLLGYLRAQTLTAAAGDGTNWYPPNPGTMGGQTPASNQGCRDGWYDLSTSNVLETVGLSKAEFGVTAWGGSIEYCRDYDPLGTKVPNATPHYAAIRINKVPSSGAAGNAPDPGVIGNNIILTF